MEKLYTTVGRFVVAYYTAKIGIAVTESLVKTGKKKLQEAIARKKIEDGLKDGSVVAIEGGYLFRSKFDAEMAREEA